MPEVCLALTPDWLSAASPDRVDQLVHAIDALASINDEKPTQGALGCYMCGEENSIRATERFYEKLGAFEGPRRLLPVEWLAGLSNCSMVGSPLHLDQFDRFLYFLPPIFARILLEPDQATFVEWLADLLARVERTRDKAWTHQQIEKLDQAVEAAARAFLSAPPTASPLYLFSLLDLVVDLGLDARALLANWMEPSADEHLFAALGALGVKQRPAWSSIEWGRINEAWLHFPAACALLSDDDNRARVEELFFSAEGDQEKQERLSLIEASLANLAQARPQKLALTPMWNTTPDEHIVHRRLNLPDRVCPSCGRELPPSETREGRRFIDLVDDRLVRVQVAREYVRCSCGHEALATDAPEVLGQSAIGPGAAALVLTWSRGNWQSVQEDERKLGKAGIDYRELQPALVDAAADMTQALRARALAHLAEQPVVFAHRMTLPEPDARVLWAFGANVSEPFGWLTATVLAPVQEPPAAVLDASDQTLVVDVHAELSPHVLREKGLPQGACLHRLWDQLRRVDEGYPGRLEVLEAFREVYRVEHEMLARGLVGSGEHAKLRRTTSSRAMGRIRRWMQTAAEQAKWMNDHQRKQVTTGWEAYERFLEDVTVPPWVSPGSRAPLLKLVDELMARIGTTSPEALVASPRTGVLRTEWVSRSALARLIAELEPTTS